MSDSETFSCREQPTVSTMVSADLATESTSPSSSVSHSTKLLFESNLEEYEKLFCNRYTSKDEDFVKKSNVNQIEPIHIFPWQTRGNDFNGGNNGGRGNRRTNNNQRWNPRDRNFEKNTRNEGSNSRRQRDFDFHNQDAGNFRGQSNYDQGSGFNHRRRNNWAGPCNSSDSSVKEVDEQAK